MGIGVIDITWLGIRMGRGVSKSSGTDAASDQAVTTAAGTAKNGFARS